jgi:hypothetical protein
MARAYRDARGDRREIVNTLDALSRIDSIFNNWLLVDFPNPSSGDAATDYSNMKMVSLGTARPRITEIIENNVVLNDARDPSPDEGYSVVAVGGELYSPREVHIGLKAGGKYDGDMPLEFGCNKGPSDLTMVTYPLYKAALLTINAVWRASWDLRLRVPLRHHFCARGRGRARRGGDQDRRRDAGPT